MMGDALAQTTVSQLDAPRAPSCIPASTSTSWADGYVPAVKLMVASFPE